MKNNMSNDTSTAFFSLTQAEYAAGNFKKKVAEGSMSARVRVSAGLENVAGVKLPVFTLFETGAAVDNQSLGLVGGGKKIQQVREKFTDLLNTLVRLASLQTSFVTLGEDLTRIKKVQGKKEEKEKETKEREKENRNKKKN